MDILIKLIVELPDLVFMLSVLIIWMISHQMVINYTQKNLKSICRDLYGDENYYTGKLDMYDMLYLEAFAMGLFTLYLLVYKRLNRFTLFERHKDIDLFFPNLNQERALIVINKHRKWFHLISVSTILIALWLLISVLAYYY